MRRRLLSILLVMSWALCATTCAVWLRSFYADDWVGRIHYAPGIDKEDHHLWISSHRGIISIVSGGDPADNFPNVRWEWRRLPIRPADNLIVADEPPILHTVGIAWELPHRLITGETSTTLEFRMLLPAAFSFLAAISIVAVRHSLTGRRLAGSCLRCGYDLRATPHRCPECGADSKATT